MVPTADPEDGSRPDDRFRPDDESRPNDRSQPADGSQPDDETERAEPAKRTDSRRPVVAFVDGNDGRRKRIRAKIDGPFELETYRSPTAAVAGFDESLAVFASMADFPATELEDAVRLARERSPHVEVVLLAHDEATLEELEVQADEELTSPLSWSRLESRIRALLMRVQYSVALKQYFRLTLAANNRRVALRNEDLDADEEYQRMEAEIERLQEQLDRLTRAFDPADFETLMTKLHHGGARTTDGERERNPRIHGLPDSCPRCRLSWGVWHGPNLGYGFDRIAAFVWRCTECDHVISNPDPNHRRIARR